MLGIGVNVAVELAELPPDVRARAATLGRPPEALEATLDELLAHLERAARRTAGGLPGRAARRDALRDRPIRWAGGEGTGAGIDDAGALLVRLADGSVRTLDAGEVHLGSVDDLIVAIRDNSQRTDPPPFEPPSVLGEQRRRARALDREHPALGRDAAGRGEAAQLAAGREHAVAGDDDRERVAPERLADRVRGAALADPLGDLAVGERLARRDRARDRVDAAVEPGTRSMSSATAERSRGSPSSSATIAVDRAPDVRGRRALVRARDRAPDAPAERVLVGLGELHADDAALAPRDAAAAERRVEEGVAGRFHALRTYQRPRA